MSPAEITRYRHALKAGKLPERWSARALLNRHGVFTEAELCGALRAVKDAPPRKDETPRDLDSSVRALLLALSRDRPRGGVRILLDLIQWTNRCAPIRLTEQRFQPMAFGSGLLYRSVPSASRSRPSLMETGPGAEQSNRRKAITVPYLI